MTSSTEGLELAQIIFYALATLPAFYCFAVHGKHGLAGWLYVIAMCGLRLVGNAMAYHALTSTGEPNKTASIINGIGLSPILLAALGILHEANHSIQRTLPAFLGGFCLLIPHMVIAGGIALAAASGSNPRLLEVGMIIFGMGWVIVSALTGFSWKANASSRRVDGESKLLLAVMVALPLIGIRIIYSIVTAFANGSGSLAVQVIFGTLPEFVVMIVYLSAGVWTRNLARDRAEQKPEPAYDTAYNPV